MLQLLSVHDFLVFINSVTDPSRKAAMLSWDIGNVF